MKLYFKPGACSLATRIILEELGIPYDAEQVDARAGRTAGGDDYRRINPRGYVPALAWHDGTVLTESAAILQYLADTHDHAGLAPAYGSIARARLQQWLNVTASELHKAFGPFFDDPVPVGEAADSARARLARRMDDVERDLADGRAFVLGDAFSVADAYLFVVLNWSGAVGLDLERWPACAGFVARCAQRPAVRRARAKEGLIVAEVVA